MLVQVPPVFSVLGFLMLRVHRQIDKPRNCCVVLREDRRSHTLVVCRVATSLGRLRVAWGNCSAFLGMWCARAH